jgi:Ca2+-binding RTX toxin-like protein
MNRLYILLAVMVVMVGALFTGHEALAKVLTGTAGGDRLIGTDRDDRLRGRRRSDHLKGSRGADRIWGSRGNDKIMPAEGNDKVYAGAGNDLSYARHPRCGLHRLRGRLRQSRNHTPPRQDSE